MELEGFELKISRSDWRHELMAPEKAESWGSVCDRWWLVVSDEDIVQQGELPSTWGLMAAEETGLKVVRPAPKLEPSVLSRTHLAGMMASALGYRLAEQRYYYSCGMDRGRRRAEEDVDRLEEEVRQLRRAIADFEEASGLSIAGRGIVPAVVGRIVRAVLDGKAEGLRLNQIKGYRTRALGIVERLVKDLDELVELEELVAGAIRQNKRDQDSGGDPLGS